MSLTTIKFGENLASGFDAGLTPYVADIDDIVNSVRNRDTCQIRVPHAAYGVISSKAGLLMEEFKEMGVPEQLYRISAKQQQANFMILPVYQSTDNRTASARALCLGKKGASPWIALNLVGTKNNDFEHFATEKQPFSGDNI